DENIFLYYEDVDIQKRIKDRGYKIYCLSKELFFHYERSSVRDKNSLIKYHFFMHKSKIYYMKKHFNPYLRIALRIFHIAGYLSRLAILPVRKKFKNEKSVKIAEYLIVLGVHTGLLRKI
ncbi:MAG: hypothetical protein LWX07_13175, partial [Bacteroidetes bacterium]|nr:hypothetical protein [Bacteroidota bacterium]